MNPRRTFAACLLVSTPLVIHAAAADQQPRARTTERLRDVDRAPDLAQTIRDRIESTFNILSDDLDFTRATRAFQTIFDQVIAYNHTDVSLMRDSAFALRFAAQLGQADKAHHRTLFELFRDNDELARTLVFLVGEADHTAQVYDILARLHAAEARAVAQFPSLAAAICVVYDTPRYSAWSMAELARGGERRQIDPVDVFRYFSRNAGQMMYSPRTTAPELLIYIVETTADIPELRWALSRHGGDRMVHKRYGDISYDTASFKYNRPKRISEHPYTLENIRRVGGVCEEQAHYACHVARAIGVPAVYISGRSATGAHAWVGVVQQRGGGPVWYMEEGRHGDYRDVRGNVVHPQTGRSVPDDEVALSARLVNVPMADRHTATAYLDAAHRTWQARASWPPPPVDETSEAPREASDEFSLSLLERAANAAPTMPEVWRTLEAAARTGRLGNADRARWFDALYKAVGSNHPDFCFNIISGIIESVDDAAVQSTAWEWVIRQSRQRPDLSAQAYVFRARAWRKAGNRHEAYLCYMEAVNRFGNDAPAAVTALLEAEQLLKEGNREGHTLEMYRQAFQRVRRPSTSSAAFFRQSNFYRVGHRYATLLEAAGDHSRADRIRRQIATGAPRD